MSGRVMNPYVTDGAVTRIYITRRNGSVHEVLIDTEDLPRVLDVMPLHIAGKGGYVNFTRGRKKVQLHRYLLNAPDHLLVDHREGRVLDNRKKHLRLTNQSQNGQNRTRPNRNNTSGARGVSYSERHNAYCSYLKVNKRKIHLGLFKSLESARIAAEVARRLLMTHSMEAAGGNNHRRMG